jgi:hypothetical protein
MNTNTMSTMSTMNTMRMKKIAVAVAVLVLLLSVVAMVHTPGTEAQVSGGPVTVQPDTTGVVATSAAFTSTLGATVFSIKAGGGNLYGYDLYNNAAAACWVQIFNGLAASVQIGTTAPSISVGMATLQGKALKSDIAILNSTTGLGAAATTTATGATPCATVMPANFFFK